ncbi:MAG: IS110 family transposase [Gammaproteobacteria bacterium]|nr:IS110 family transposase [Gammaproteobacteria bacterium]
MQIIGIDVSKEKLDCLWLRNVDTGKVKTKVFQNTAKDHLQLIEWSLKHTGLAIDQVHFVMEATGIYHEALAYALYQAGARVSVVNPAQVRDYAKGIAARTKTDKKDSFVLARFGIAESPRLWHPEAEEIRVLKALLARYNALQKDIQRELNRREKAHISCVSREVLQSIDTVVAQLDDEAKRVDALISDHINQNPSLKNDRQLLESIPAVGPVISQYMMSVINSRDFRSAAQCAAYLGLNPVQHESGCSVRGRSHLSKAGSSIVRAKLYMAAVVAIRYNPDVKHLYERLLKRGKSTMSALCAAMRKLVHICFGVLKHQTPYQAQCVL